MRALTPAVSAPPASVVLSCQHAHVGRTHHWPGNNLWSRHPVLEAHVLDMDAPLWQPLEELLRNMLTAVGLPTHICLCLPQQNGRGRVVLEASEASLGRCIVTQCVELVGLPGHALDRAWPHALARVRQVIDADCLGPSTACIALAATQRQLPVFRLLPQGNLVQLGMGAAQQRIWTAESDFTSAIGQDIAADKALTKHLLAQAGIPTPAGAIATSAAHAWQLAQDWGLPVVVKPLDGNRARGVSVDLGDQASVETAWQLAQREGSQVLVERYIRGHEHRLLVVGEHVVAATRGETLDVVGDGQMTVAQLVDTQINQHPRCLIDMTLERIELARNPKILGELQRQQLQPHDIPGDGQRVTLLRTGNLTVDCTNEVHPDIAHHAVLAARTVGLDIAGIDLVAQDIRQPLLAQGGAIVEVNAGPSLLMHLHPVHGAPQAVGQAICNHLFPHPDDGRIPLTGILAEHHAAQRMAHSLALWQQALGFTTGMANGEAMFIQNQRMQPPPPPALPAGVRVLMHRAVNAAVIAQDLQGCARDGWAYPLCDLALILPAGWALHDSTEQRIVAAHLRNVRSGGTAVLGTGCPPLESLALTCLGRIIWVDTDEDHPTLQAHRRVNGGVVFVRDGQVVCAQGMEEIMLPLPAELGDWQVQEWLAVAAAGWAMQWPLSVLHVIAQQTQRNQSSNSGM